MAGYTFQFAWKYKELITSFEGEECTASVQPFTDTLQTTEGLSIFIDSSLYDGSLTAEKQGFLMNLLESKIQMMASNGMTHQTAPLLLFKLKEAGAGDSVVSISPIYIKSGNEYIRIDNDESISTLEENTTYYVEVTKFNTVDINVIYYDTLAKDSRLTKKVTFDINQDLTQFTLEDTVTIATQVLYPTQVVPAVALNDEGYDQAQLPQGLQYFDYTWTYQKNTTVPQVLFNNYDTTENVLDDSNQPVLNEDGSNKTITVKHKVINDLSVLTFLGMAVIKLSNTWLNAPSYLEDSAPTIVRYTYYNSKTKDQLAADTTNTTSAYYPKTIVLQTLFDTYKDKCNWDMPKYIPTKDSEPTQDNILESTNSTINYPISKDGIRIAEGVFYTYPKIMILPLEYYLDTNALNAEDITEEPKAYTFDTTSTISYNQVFSKNLTVVEGTATAIILPATITIPSGEKTLNDNLTFNDLFDKATMFIRCTYAKDYKVTVEYYSDHVYKTKNDQYCATADVQSAVYKIGGFDTSIELAKETDKVSDLLHIAKNNVCITDHYIYTEGVDANIKKDTNTLELVTIDKLFTDGRKSSATIGDEIPVDDKTFLDGTAKQLFDSHNHVIKIKVDILKTLKIASVNASYLNLEYRGKQLLLHSQSTADRTIYHYYGQDYKVADLIKYLQTDFSLTLDGGEILLPSQWSLTEAIGKASDGTTTIKTTNDKGETVILSLTSLITRSVFTSTPTLRYLHCKATKDIPTVEYTVGSNKVFSTTPVGKGMYEQYTIKTDKTTLKVPEELYDWSTAKYFKKGKLTLVTNEQPNTGIFPDLKNAVITLPESNIVETTPSGSTRFQYGIDLSRLQSNLCVYSRWPAKDVTDVSLREVVANSHQFVAKEGWPPAVYLGVVGAGGGAGDAWAAWGAMHGGGGGSSGGYAIWKLNLEKFTSASLNAATFSVTGGFGGDYNRNKTPDKPTSDNTSYKQKEATAEGEKGSDMIITIKGLKLRADSTDFSLVITAPGGQGGQKAMIVSNDRNPNTPAPYAVINGVRLENTTSTAIKDAIQLYKSGKGAQGEMPCGDRKDFQTSGEYIKNVSENKTSFELDFSAKNNNLGVEVQRMLYGVRFDETLPPEVKPDSYQDLKNMLVDEQKTKDKLLALPEAKNLSMFELFEGGYTMHSGYTGTRWGGTGGCSVMGPASYFINQTANSAGDLGSVMSSTEKAIYNDKPLPGVGGAGASMNYHSKKKESCMGYSWGRQGGDGFFGIFR